MSGPPWKYYQLSFEDQEDVSRDQPVQADARESTRLQQLIIRPGGEGGFLTRTEVSLAKFCAEEKLKNKSADRLISMIKRCDIRAETIWELEPLISDSKIFSSIFGLNTDK
jgi:hypothetical protein